jgi:hypothetical protein
VEHASNICLQVYTGREGTIDERETHLAQRLGEFGARLDGKKQRTLVYTIPLAPGVVTRLTAAMRQYIETFTKDQWQYANFFDPRGDHQETWWRERA